MFIFIRPLSFIVLYNVDATVILSCKSHAHGDAENAGPEKGDLLHGRPSSPYL